MKHFIELSGLDAHDGIGRGDHFFLDHVHGHVESGRSRAFAHAGLKHVEFALLNGKLNVLHVVVMFLEFLLNSHRVVYRGRALILRDS